MYIRICKTTSNAPARDRHWRILEDLFLELGHRDHLGALHRFGDIKRLGERVTTVFARRGSYALDPRAVGALSPADFTIERIGDLLNVDVPRLRPTPPMAAS